MTVILALDLSKRSTGWALGHGGTPPLARSIGFRGAGRGAVLAEYFHWLRDRLITNAPDLVAYEAPIKSTRAKGSTETMMLLWGMAAITEAVCSMKGLRMVAVPIPTWRKAFLGHGYPIDPKGDAVRMCDNLGWPVQTHDEAEACGVWCWAHLSHGDADAMHDQLSRAKVRSMEGEPG